LSAVETGLEDLCELCSSMQILKETRPHTFATKTNIYLIKLLVNNT